MTDRNRYERDDLYRTIFQESNDAILVFDPSNDRILDCNPAATELLGYEHEELLSLGPTDVHPHDYDAYETFVDYVLDNGQGWTVDLSCRTKSGEEVETVISASDCRLGGNPCVVATLREISELKKKRRDLKRENEHLENVANILSHDLRNPLNVAMGHVQMAKRDSASDSLETAEEALERVSEIVDNVSTLARAKGTVESESLETVSLDDLVRNCWANLETDAADLVVESDLTFRADPNRLRHVFENLFWNAVEHGSTNSPKQSDETVANGGRSKPDGEDPKVTITVGGTADGFFVADDGTGIPAEATEKIFEAGFSSAENGTGLGLSIVEQIVEAHDWEIDVSESRNGGTRFDVNGVSREI